MEQKSAVIARVLELTRAQIFTGTPESAEAESDAFSELYERREIVLQSMTKLESQLQEEAQAQAITPGQPLIDANLNEQLKQIVANQKEMATTLIALDEANFKAYEKIKSHLVGDLKNVRQTKDVNERYSDNFYFNEEQGHYFDKKN